MPPLRPSGFALRQLAPVQPRRGVVGQRLVGLGGIPQMLSGRPVGEAIGRHTQFFRLQAPAPDLLRVVARFAFDATPAIPPR